MPDKLTKDLDPLTDPQVNDDTKLIPMAVPSTGKLYKATVAQLKSAFGVRKVKYVATGAEGSTITIPALAGFGIFVIMRENAPMYEVVSSPDPAEFTWDGSNIHLGLAVNPIGGERFLILYGGS